MGKIFYIMGKSSSGKDSIVRSLKKQISELQDIVPYTTRPIRENETQGVEYHFRDNAFLQRMQKEGKVIEQRSYNTKHGIWTYFTVDEGQIDLLSASYLTIGTLESYMAMREYFGARQIIPIYIEVEDGARLLRAIEREQQQLKPKYKEVARRFLADSDDFSEEKLEEAGIQRRFENIRFEDCLAEVCQYINQKLEEER